jgi:hypothetical protein
MTGDSSTVKNESRGKTREGTKVDAGGGWRLYALVTEEDLMSEQVEGWSTRCSR